MSTASDIKQGDVVSFTHHPHHTNPKIIEGLHVSVIKKGLQSTLITSFRDGQRQQFLLDNSDPVTIHRPGSKSA